MKSHQFQGASPPDPIWSFAPLPQDPTGDYIGSRSALAIICPFVTYIVKLSYTRPGLYIPDNAVHTVCACTRVSHKRTCMVSLTLSVFSELHGFHHARLYTSPKAP